VRTVYVDWGSFGRTHRVDQWWVGPACTALGLVLLFGYLTFRAFDATSGKVLWQTQTQSGVIGQPSSFMVDGTQYIAVQSGWGIDARSMQRRLEGIKRGEFPDVPEGGQVWVFAVK